MDIGEIVEQQRIRAAQLDIDRIIVHLLRRFVGGQVATQRRNRIADALQRSEHVIGREIRAVVKLHTLAQMKTPDRPETFSQDWASAGSIFSSAS